MHEGLLAATVALAFCVPASAFAGPDADWGTAARQSARINIDAHVREAEQRFGMPAQWIYAVIRAESGGRVRAVSSAGAMGLMQLMPGTWARQRARYGLGSDPFDPRDNILAGTSYLREMYDRFGAPGFLAAYNAGPGRYEAWRAGRRTLPLETRRYVARLAPQLQAERLFVAAEAPSPDAPGTAESAARDRAMVTPADTAGEAPENPFAHPAHDLFVAVSTAGDR